MFVDGLFGAQYSLDILCYYNFNQETYQVTYFSSDCPNLWIFLVPLYKLNL